jgi:hypothetical protein
MTMLMKIMNTCIAAAVALGFSIAVPAASYAQGGDKDKSATASTDKPKAPAKKHKKHKKGFAGKENQSEGGK